MIAAMRAAISLPVLKAMERCANHATLAAVVANAKPNVHQTFKAGVIIREPLEELADRKFALEAVLFHDRLP
jgi:hypothetical protein